MEPIELTQAQPEEYPTIARLLADAFSGGKYAVAFGREVAQRRTLFEIMLHHHALTAGVLYVARLPGDPDIAGTVVVKYDNIARIRPEARRAARQAIAAHAGRLRAWWAAGLLSLFSSPHLAPESCYMDDLVVNPVYRRQRIAQRILAATFHISRQKGKTEMLADIISTNKKVIGLVQLTGWEIVRRSYAAAPVTLPLFGFASVYRIRKDLTQSDEPAD